jgi:hypothetical protein
LSDKPRPLWVNLSSLYMIPLPHHIERTIYGKDVMDLTIFGLRLPAASGRRGLTVEQLGSISRPRLCARRGSDGLRGATLADR